MVKKEFIKKYAKVNNLEYKEAQKIVDDFLAFTTEILRQEDILIFRGFGTFHKRKRASRKIRSYYTKEITYSKEKEYIFFKPSTILLEK